jgi:hypothetical protein
MYSRWPGEILEYVEDGVEMVDGNLVSREPVSLNGEKMYSRWPGEILQTFEDGDNELGRLQEDDNERHLVSLSL